MREGALPSPATRHGSFRTFWRWPNVTTPRHVIELRPAVEAGLEERLWHWGLDREPTAIPAMTKSTRASISQFDAAAASDRQPPMPTNRSFEARFHGWSKTSMTLTWRCQYCQRQNVLNDRAWLAGDGRRLRASGHTRPADLTMTPLCRQGIGQLAPD